MAGLRNSLRDITFATAVGVAPVGDSVCHTDPVLAHGLAFALIHARALSRALQANAGSELETYAQAITPLATERFRFASDLDAQRLALWTGDKVDVTDRSNNHALFTMVAGAVAASIDPDIARLYLRRIGLLDSTDVLDHDIVTQDRIGSLARDALSRPRGPTPTRHEMQAITHTIRAR
jgi:hypothetical protein